MSQASFSLVSVHRKPSGKTRYILKFSKMLRAKRKAPDRRNIPGFRHRIHEPEYARLGLPFCHRDSIRKLAVLLDDEAAYQSKK